MSQASASITPPHQSPDHWLSAVRDAPALAALARRVDRGGVIACRGVAGSSASIVTAALAERGERPILLVLAHLDDADEALDELESLGIDAARLPAMEVVPGESSVNLEQLAERFALVRRLYEAGAPSIVVTSIAALMQTIPSAEELPRFYRSLVTGAAVDVNELFGWLDGAGYRRVEAIESPGEFAVRGGVIDIFPAGGAPARVDLFGDDIERINEIDLATMGSDRIVPRIDLIGASVEQLQAEAGTTLLPSVLPEPTAVVLADLAEIAEQGRSYLERVADARGITTTSEVQRAVVQRCHAVVELHRLGASGEDVVVLPVEPIPSFAETTSEAVAELCALARRHRTVALCQNDGEAQRMGELITQHRATKAEGAASSGDVRIETRYLHRGFVWGEAGDGASLALVPYHELLHRYQLRRKIRRVAGSRAIDAFLDLQPGDHVVHRDHGIARFAGLQTMSDGGAEQEYLTLEFSGSAKLHVPAAHIELVQKYVGAFKGRPELSTLGGKRWKNQKERVEEAVRDLAGEMLRLQAARESLPGIRFPEDTAWQREFEAEFPYEETDDQVEAIAAVKGDMANERPMDRLVCGDVGFGKTEVAIRAAFKAAEFGRQVAVLVPTTWLAEQHERTFRDRFADYPFRIESLSRFKTGKHVKEILDAAKKGQVDIVIGTHRLLSKDVRFADLGLVVIDEEQRFGVEHKQTLLGFRATADVLTMSATPIPRTLHMAMLGLRDISSLTTPPLDRRAIVTEVMSYDEQRVAHGISRELAREGQVFFVHNRVHDIFDVADHVKGLAPDARVAVGHGQMPARQLEKVMRSFVRGEVDILVSTTIIESGVDIPTANTMFINGAHMFGLSELHQLRGRVGRHKHRAYCYLLLDPHQTINPDAMKRLRALESFSMLGAGFQIAMRDLEIRGAGNLLGAEQSGHISAVGYEMYCQLLEQAVGELKHDPRISAVDTTVDLGISGSLPRGYIPSDARRMDAYRRISQAAALDELEEVRGDLESAYGELPRAARRLLEIAIIRVAATTCGIRSVVRHEDDIILRTARPGVLEERMKGVKGSLRLVGAPDADGLQSVYFRPPPAYLEADTLLTVLRRRLA